MKRRASIEDRGNKLWHGSRFILPEHREAMLSYDHHGQKKERPVLEEDKLYEMSCTLSEAIQNERIVALTVYHPLGNRTIEMIPKRIDPVAKCLKGVDHADQSVSVPLADILDIR
jgi:hypothetical protein